MNPRTNQMKSKQPNAQELEGKAPRTENGAIPKRVVAIGKNPTVTNTPVEQMRVDHHRKNIASDGGY